MKTFKDFISNLFESDTTDGKSVAYWRKKAKESGMFRNSSHGIEYLKKHEYGNRKQRKITAKNGDPAGDDLSHHDYAKLTYYQNSSKKRKDWRNLKPGKYGAN